MRIFAVVQPCHSGWLRATVIGNGPIERLAGWLLPFIEDDAREHIGTGIVMSEPTRP